MWLGKWPADTRLREFPRFPRVPPRRQRHHRASENCRQHPDVNLDVDGRHQGTSIGPIFSRYFKAL